jgi:hypothetical protein
MPLRVSCAAHPWLCKSWIVRLAVATMLCAAACSVLSLTLPAAVQSAAQNKSSILFRLPLHFPSALLSTFFAFH